MNKNAIIAVLGLAVVVLLAVVLLRPTTPPSPPPPPPPPEHPEPIPENLGKSFVDEQGVTKVVVESTTIVHGETNTVIEIAPTVRKVERRPLEPEATKRLHDGPVVVSAVFTASGRAEHASYGKTTKGSYLYTTTVRARSEVVEKEEDEETGGVRVVEKRTFLQARDHLGLSNLDMAVNLETLPVKQVKEWIDSTCDFVGGVVGIVIPVVKPVSYLVKKSVAAAYATLKAMDGASARWLLDVFGVEFPENLEVFVNDRVSKIAERQLQTVKVALQSIEGKTYVITYTQSETGQPLNVDFTHEDGLPITEPEWEILRTANAFLDSDIISDANCEVGDTWTVWADEVQELFGMAGEGRAEGKIRVERVEDQDDGKWTLSVKPATVSFRSYGGTAAGSMSIKDGNGLVDAKNASVESLQVTAGGSLESLNRKRHAMFFDFVKKLDGEASDMRFTLTVEPEEK